MNTYWDEDYGQYLPVHKPLRDEVLESLAASKEAGFFIVDGEESEADSFWRTLENLIEE